MENVVGPEPPGHQDGQTLPAVFIDDGRAFSMMGMGETRASPATNSLPSKINTLARCEAGFFLPKRVANRCRRKPWLSGHFQTLPKIPCNTGATRVNSMFTSCAPSEMTTNCTRSGNSMHRGREPTIQLFSITKRNTPASSPDSRSGFPVTLQKDSKSRTDPGSVDSTSSVSPA